MTEAQADRGAWQVPEGHKFTCLVTNAIGAQLGFEAFESTGVYVTGSMPFELDDFWKKGLGEFRTEDIDNASLKVVSHGEARQPEIRNSEYDQIDKRIAVLRIAMALLGVRMGNCIVIRGATVCGETKVYQCNPHIDGLKQADNVEPAYCDGDMLKRAVALSQTIAALYSHPKKYLRLKRALNVMQWAFMEHDFYERLHLFVRALDGILMTRQGQGRKDFVTRAQVITGQVFGRLLESAYDVRSATEHLADLPATMRRKRERARLLRFLEVLTGECLASILESPSLLLTFSTDTGISSIWNSSPTWSKRIHVGSIQRQRAQGWERSHA